MTETRQRSRRRFRAALGLLLMLTLVDTVIWALACRRIDDGAGDAAASAGWTLSAGAARWGGWPIAAEVTLPDMVLRAGPDIIPPLTWTAPHLVLRLSAWHPTVLTASGFGAQSLAVGTAAPMPFRTQSLVATMGLIGHDPVRIAATGFDMTAPDGPVRLASADIFIRPDGLSADLSGIIPHDRAGQPISPPIDQLRFDARAFPPIEPRQTASESAEHWRDNDGKLQFSALSLRWGPLDATGAATLTLDPDLQPAVTGQVNATGIGPVIEQFVTAGALTRSAATAAQAMLAILAAPTAGGPVTLPVAVRDGVVTVARIPLLRLAPLQWD